MVGQWHCSGSAGQGLCLWAAQRLWAGRAWQLCLCLFLLCSSRRRQRRRQQQGLLLLRQPSPSAPPRGRCLRHVLWSAWRCGLHSSRRRLQPGPHSQWRFVQLGQVCRRQDWAGSAACTEQRGCPEGSRLLQLQRRAQSRLQSAGQQQSQRWRQGRRRQLRKSCHWAGSLGRGCLQRRQ